MPNTTCTTLTDEIQEDKKTKRGLIIALLVIAAILCLIGIGLLIALAVQLYSKL